MKEFVLAEIKDLPSMLESRVQIKTEALIRFCAEKGFGLLLTDGKYTFDKLLKPKLNRKLERHILRAVQSGTVRKKQCSEIMERCGASQSELLKVVARHDLRFRMFPFKLEKPYTHPVFRSIVIEKKGYLEKTEDIFPTLFARGKYAKTNVWIS